MVLDSVKRPKRKHEHDGNSVERRDDKRSRGITWHSGMQKWMTRIWDGTRQVTLGHFTSKELAMRKYDFEALKRKGLSAPLNFPVDEYLASDGSLKSEEDIFASAAKPSVPAPPNSNFIPLSPATLPPIVSPFLPSSSSEEDSATVMHTTDPPMEGIVSNSTALLHPAHQVRSLCVESRTSEYQGVVWHKSNHKWEARIYLPGEGRQQFLGYFDGTSEGEQQAARKHDEVVLQTFGCDVARLNFINGVRNPRLRKQGGKKRGPEKPQRCASADEALLQFKINQDGVGRSRSDELLAAKAIEIKRAGKMIVIHDPTRVPAELLTPASTSTTMTSSPSSSCASKPRAYSAMPCCPLPDQRADARATTSGGAAVVDDPSVGAQRCVTEAQAVCSGKAKLSGTEFDAAAAAAVLTSLASHSDEDSVSQQTAPTSGDMAAPESESSWRSCTEVGLSLQVCTQVAAQ